VIYEHAYLTIDPARSAEFEKALDAGRGHLLAAPGCREVSVSRSVDRPGVYLLRVGWDRIEDHLEVFPATSQAVRLAETIGSFFLGEPTVIHFDDTHL
jgi:heme-degrading monooxygenase HmoA